MTFTTAIVKKPGKSMIQGITAANLGKPDFELALQQHQNYINALQNCGLKVVELEATEAYPDSIFIEDAALCTPHCAILTRPGAESRRGEELIIKETLKTFYPAIEEIKSPGTIEAGDIMMVGSHFYIGLSKRTNLNGARQMIAILESYGMTGTTVALEEMLHLKTGLSYLENNILLIYGEFIGRQEFEKYNKIKIPEEEAYAANSVWINGNVLVPAGYPKTKSMIQKLGYKILEVDVSEFRKLDGGLSCMSLRF